MYLLKSVVIDGLWGSGTPIQFPFDKDVNFLIGKNGSGKTTVINLLAATLLCDYERLDKVPFSRITLTLQSRHQRKCPIIEVVKERKAGIPYMDIRYQVKESRNAKPKILGPDNEWDSYIRHAVHAAPRVVRERQMRELTHSSRAYMQELINVSWLSVHRKDEDLRDERRVAASVPAVDQKLSSLTNDLVKYFSEMSKRYEDKTKEFQKESFLSLITYEREEAVHDFIRKVDAGAEMRGLSGVFEVLQLQPKEYAQKVQKSYEKFSSARDLYLGSKAMKLTEFFAIFNAIKAHSLVQYYEDLERKGREIFSPREEFLSVLNGLFGGQKTAYISPSNELCVNMKKRGDIQLHDLSSGEKQLIIILGEALLQKALPFVYIADEPELSLHVTWQEQLTEAITRLNPNAQIVFATHSPDIVGRHQDKVLDMERLAA